LLQVRRKSFFAAQNAKSMGTAPNARAGRAGGSYPQKLWITLFMKIAKARQGRMDTGLQPL
jgi:hypothetical protein